MTKASHGECAGSLFVVSLQAALREQPSVVMLVGNKSDKSEKDRQVGLEEGQRLAVVRIVGCDVRQSYIHRKKWWWCEEC